MSFFASYPTYPTTTVTGCWDPVSILGIRNLEHGHDVTCVGYAPSRGRRCWNPINQYNRASAWALLDKLAMMDPHTDDIEPLLRQLARYTLCQRYHQNQNNTVTATWLAKATAPSARPRPTASTGAKASIRPIAPKQESKPKVTAPSARPRPTASTDAKAPTRPMAPKQESKPKAEPSIKIEASSVEELIANLSKILDALKQEESAGAQAEQDRRAADEEEEELRAREREQAETARKQREEEQRRKDEADRVRREAEQRRQAAERARVQAQEAREREERERQEKARAEFQEAWAVYEEAGKKFDELRKSNKMTTEDLRWPVMSGSYLHVTQDAVKSFYGNALDGKTIDEKLKLLKKEFIRWHPDRHVLLNLEGEILETVNMVVSLIGNFRDKIFDERARLARL